MKIKRGNRKRLTPKERVALWSAQRGLCGCGCGELLNSREGVVGEHTFFFVSLGCSEKPDKLYRKPCALKKTNGPRGDINTIAHTKRLAEQSTQADKRSKRGFSLIQGKTKIETRGFDKSRTRGFDGKVRERG
jgi:hypothetical protein